MQPKHTRIFGLDILRTIAILTVLWGHIYFIPKNITDQFSPFVSLQFIDGVAIFFTLSGFLIGGILFKKLATGEPTIYTLLRFWRDRWFRTLPAYFFVLMLLFIATIKENPVTGYLPYLTFLQNLKSGHLFFFGESWSLCVEEWFYLTTPILFILAVRKRIPVIYVIASILVVGNLLRIYKISRFPIADIEAFNYLVRNTLMARVDAIMYGVLGAYLLFYRHPLWINHKRIFFYTGLIGYACIHIIYAFSPANFFMLYLYLPLQGTFTLMLLPFVNSIKEGRGKIAKFVTYISMTSYSLYLVHGSLFIYYIKPMLPDNFWILLPFYFGWAFGASYLMYRFVEQPFMRMRDKRKVDHQKKKLQPV